MSEVCAFAESTFDNFASEAIESTSSDLFILSYNELVTIIFTCYCFEVFPLWLFIIHTFLF